jgi:hypothetical protein
MKALVPATCDRCGKKIYPVNINGMPSGIAAELEDGKTITLCQDCIIRLGSIKDDKEASDQFWKEAGI